MKTLVLAILVLCVAACEPPQNRTTESRPEGPANRVETSSVTNVSAVRCPKPDCGLTNINLRDVVPEDNEHCAVWCCLGEYGGCHQHMYPWINKSTGKTDTMYDTRERKFIKIN